MGALLSIVYVTLDPEADFLVYGTASQMLRQGFGMLATLAVALISGYGTGKLIKQLPGSETDGKDYRDSVWWHAEYFDSSKEM